MLSLTVAAPLVSAVSHALMLLLLSRSAEPAEVAGILALQASISFVIAVLEFGIGRELSVVAAVGPRSEFVYLNRLHWLICIAVGLIASLVSLFLGVGAVAVFIVIYCVAERRVACQITSSIASGRLLTSSVSLIVGRVVTLGAVCALLANEPISAASAYALSVGCGSMFLAIWLNFVPKKPVEDGRPRRSILSVMQVSLHYWATTLMAQARSLDVVLVTMLVPPAQAASYSLPARALQPLRIVGTSLANIAFPLAASKSQDRLSKIIAMSHLAGLTGTAAVLLCFPWISLLVEAFLGPGYESAAVPLTLIALGAAINIPGAVLSSVLQASGRQRSVTTLGVVLLVFQAFALIVLTPLFGVNGAAVSLLLTYVLQFATVTTIYRTWRARGE